MLRSLTTKLITAMGIDVSGWANSTESKYKLVIYFLDGNGRTKYSRIKQDKKNIEMSGKKLVNYWTKNNKDLNFKSNIYIAILYSMITGFEIGRYDRNGSKIFMFNHNID